MSHSLLSWGKLLNTVMFWGWLLTRYRLVNGLIDHLYTPLGTILYRSLTHTDQCPQSITVSTSRFLAKASRSGDSLASCTQVLLSQTPVQNSSTGNSTNCFPGWWLFHTNLQVFSSQADFQLTTNYWTHSLTNQLLHVTSLNWTADSSNQQLMRCFKLSCL
jgi:hypothetical protein